MSKEDTIATEIKGPDAAVVTEAGADNMDLRNCGLLSGSGSFDSRNPGAIRIEKKQLETGKDPPKGAKNVGAAEA